MSCRLARQSGHVQIAWTFLVEAKALGVNLKDVGMEEARFEFQKGNQSQAIGLLTKLLNTKFADMNKLFTNFVHWHECGAKSTADSPDVLVKKTSKESRAAFAETEAIQSRGSDARATEMNNRDTATFAPSAMNTEISRAFRQLDSYAFYTAFPQLISRIVHPNASVFSTLKAILADLICKYPHQCIWQSIAVYRTGPWQKSIRQERCSQVFAVVKNKRHNMDQLIDQYDYVAAALIELAEKKVKNCGSFSDLPRVSPRLHNFFTSGELQCGMLMGARDRGLSGVRTVSPSIMIPLTEMMEHALPKEHNDQEGCGPDFHIVMDTTTTPTESLTELPEVFIANVDPDYLVLKSLLKPKRIALRGGDGRRYLIMCKPNDELRKDARFMDVNRVRIDGFYISII
ncbi:hypothetical protein COOONC_19059 [Cooperia oncophora]